MDDLIGRLVATTGVDRTAAQKAVGVILQFLLKEGPTEKVHTLLQHMPGADAAMLASHPSSSSPSLFGAVGGLARFQAEWAPVSRPESAPLKEVERVRTQNRKSTFAERAPVGVGTQMMAAGLRTEQIQAITRETMSFARENAGEDAVGEIVGAIPGLGQFV